MAIRALKHLLKNREPGFDGKKPKFEYIDAGQILKINTKSAPLENLASTGQLETSDDEPGQGLMRAQAGRRLRDVIEGSQVSALKSPNLEGSGGGAAGGRPVADFKMDCIKEVVDLQAAIKPASYKLLCNVCFDDVWVWHGQGRKQAEITILRLLRALDLVAVFYGRMPQRDYDKRWGVKRARRKPQPPSESA